MKTLAFAFCFLLTAGTSFGQQPGPAGTWEGTLSGMSIRLVFHISEKDGQLSTKLDSPDQGAFGLACDQTTFANGKIVISLALAGASYEGTLTENQIQGNWKQGGGSVGLDLKRKDRNVKPAVKPQTPQAPFSYHSEDVEYENADHSIHYGATLTYPDGGGSFPTVILITGSGLQDRDETIGLHKPFAVIAHYLTQKGIAVLRIDDRGIGKSTGDTKNATSADFAKDVETSLAYLKTRAEIDVKKIGLVGHSEGGMIGPLVASRHPEIAFVVMLAGPGIPIQELMAEQSAATLRTVGISQEAIQAYMPFYRKLSEVIPRSPSAEEARKSAWVEFQKWQNATPKELIAATTGTTDSASAQKFVGHFTDQLYSPWFRYFMQYNPQPTLRELHCPVLALNGEKDVQVIAKSNLEGIRLSLKKNKKTTIQELTGLNHLFQTCTTCGVGEYFTLEETFSPTALALMGNWIKEVVR